MLAARPDTNLLLSSSFLFRVVRAFRGYVFSWQTHGIHGQRNKKEAEPRNTQNKKEEKEEGPKILPFVWGFFY